jgi:hypothetical protein
MCGMILFVQSNDGFDIFIAQLVSNIVFCQQLTDVLTEHSGFRNG